VDLLRGAVLVRFVGGLSVTKNSVCRDGVPSLGVIIVQPRSAHLVKTFFIVGVFMFETSKKISFPLIFEGRVFGVGNEGRPPRPSGLISN